MNIRVLAQGDTSFINNITPWLPDFLGVALAIGIVIAVIGGVMVFAGIAFARQDGRGDQVSGRLLWWGGGVVGLGVLMPIVGWLLG